MAVLRCLSAKINYRNAPTIIRQGMNSARISIPGLGDYDDDSDEEPQASNSTGRSPSPAPKADLWFMSDFDTKSIRVVDISRPEIKAAAEAAGCLLEKLTVAVLGRRVRESEIDSDDDNYIHCDKCDSFYEPMCRIHPLFWIKGKEVPEGSVERAAKSAPAFILIQKSKIPNAGFGAFTKVFIPVGVIFGPYQGVLRDEENTDGYIWEIRHKDGNKFIDGSLKEYSNWLRYINSPRHEAEQNMLAFQYNGSVYYRVIKPIDPMEELFVWYGKRFGQSLGVFTTKPMKKGGVANKNPFIL